MASSAHQELLTFRAELAATEATHALSLFERSRLQTISNSLRETFMAEVQGRYVFSPSDKRFDLAKLVWSVSSLLAPGVFDLLPAVAQYDLSEAGICIAFERATAAAFHSLRATEAALREAYVAVVPLEKQRSRPMWADMVKDLRAEGMIPEHVLNHFDHIRQNFRNPTDHPDKMFNIYEAQNVFGLCLDGVEQLAPYF